MEIQSSLVLAIPERIEKIAISRGKISLNITTRNMETTKTTTNMVMARTWSAHSQDTRLMRALFKTVWQPQPKLHFSILLIRMNMEKLSWSRRQIWIRSIIKLRTMPERESIQIVGDTMSLSTTLRRRR